MTLNCYPYLYTNFCAGLVRLRPCYFICGFEFDYSFQVRLMVPDSSPGSRTVAMARGQRWQFQDSAMALGQWTRLFLAGIQMCLKIKVKNRILHLAFELRLLRLFCSAYSAYYVISGISSAAFRIPYLAVSAASAAAAYPAPCPFPMRKYRIPDFATAHARQNCRSRIRVSPSISVSVTWDLFCHPDFRRIYALVWLTLKKSQVLNPIDSYLLL